MGWTNNAASLIEANTVVVIAGAPYSGVFVYSGTPAAGNLTASIAASDGTDPYGNKYGIGFISYPSGHTRAVGMAFGSLLLGDPTTDFTNGASIRQALFFGGNITADSGTGDATHLDAASLSLTAGNASTLTGGATPQLLLLDDAGTSDLDVLLSGSVIRTDQAGNPTTWQTPAYAANWAGTTAFSGLGGDALQFHLMPDNTLWLLGLAIASTGAGTTVFTLPSRYRPASGTPHGQVAHLTTAGGIPTLAEIAITGAGLVIVSAGIANGDTLSFNVRIPMHNVG